MPLETLLRWEIELDELYLARRAGKFVMSSHRCFGEGAQCANRCSPMWWQMWKHRFSLRLKEPAKVYVSSWHSNRWHKCASGKCHRSDLTRQLFWWARDLSARDVQCAHHHVDTHTSSILLPSEFRFEGSLSVSVQQSAVASRNPVQGGRRQLSLEVDASCIWRLTIRSASSELSYLRKMSANTCIFQVFELMSTRVDRDWRISF